MITVWPLHAVGMAVRKFPAIASFTGTTGVELSRVMRRERERPGASSEKSRPRPRSTPEREECGAATQARALREWLNRWRVMSIASLRSSPVLFYLSYTETAKLSVTE